MTHHNRPIIALIPARGGSKGVKGKNLRKLGSKPLIAYTIEAAKGSKKIDEVYVSSDNNTILDTAEEWGAIRITRSAQAASDHATASMVVREFLDSIGIAEKPELQQAMLVYLQPTSPLRHSGHIDEAFDEMDQHGVERCLSVTPSLQSPYKAFTLDPSGLLSPLFSDEKTNSNRQMLAPTFHPNGAIYIFPVKDFLIADSFPSTGSLPFVMSAQDSIDIDTESDFLKAEKYVS